MEISDNSAAGLRNTGCHDCKNWSSEALVVKEAE